jgi:hypothetical protein
MAARKGLSTYQVTQLCAWLAEGLVYGTLKARMSDHWQTTISSSAVSFYRKTRADRIARLRTDLERREARRCADRIRKFIHRHGDDAA